MPNPPGSTSAPPSAPPAAQGPDDPLRRTSRLRRQAAYACALVLVALALLTGLAALPYSTSLFSCARPGEVLQPPSPDFQVGPLAWPVSTFATSPDLRQFREHYRDTCGTSAGLDAAICISDVMAEAFPNGEPQTEFVQTNFDPVKHLQAHLGGQPGHCMNRSAILATELLSAGVPARVVQLMSRDLLGHTVVEVWDPQTGWTVLDPTAGAVLESPRSTPSAVELVLANDGVRWRRLSHVPSGPSEPLDPRLFAGGTVIYPEPWLYVRTGERFRLWPYRARYVWTGRVNLVIGPAQILASLGIVVCGLGALTYGGILVSQVLPRRSSGG